MLKEVRIIQIFISVIAVIFLSVHLILPSIAIDSISLSLIVIVILPWLVPLIKSVKLPGGLEIEFQELKNLESRSKKAGLLSFMTKKIPATKYAYQIIKDQDPNLALAGLRIELEKVIRDIAEDNNIPTERLSLGKLLFTLSDKKILTNNERSVLSDLTGVLNRAVHGAEVDERAIMWAMDIGTKILTSLRERSNK